jgi:hypothetical protein
MYLKTAIPILHLRKDHFPIYIKIEVLKRKMNGGESNTLTIFIYRSCSDIGDKRGYTAGYAGFTVNRLDEWFLKKKCPTNLYLT